MEAIDIGTRHNRDGARDQRLWLLTGFRSQPAADIKVMEEILLRFSYLAEEVSDIVDLDLNLIIALPEGQGCRFVDARIRVKPSTPRPVV